jgi:mRNA interferase YafQ
MSNIATLFHLSENEARMARETILFAIELLANGDALPSGLHDHALNREPWNGYREFHALDDLLVVYYRIDSKNRLRMVTLTNHEELSSGKLQR